MIDLTFLFPLVSYLCGGLVVYINTVTGMEKTRGEMTGGEKTGEKRLMGKHWWGKYLALLGISGALISYNLPQHILSHHTPIFLQRGPYSTP